MLIDSAGRFFFLPLDRADIGCGNAVLFFTATFGLYTGIIDELTAVGKVIVHRSGEFIGRARDGHRAIAVSRSRIVASGIARPVFAGPSVLNIRKQYDSSCLEDVYRQAVIRSG